MYTTRCSVYGLVTTSFLLLQQLLAYSYLLSLLPSKKQLRLSYMKGNHFHHRLPLSSYNAKPEELVFDIIETTATSPSILPEQYLMRFINVARMYDGQRTLQRLYHAHVCVVGLGGVGSWVVEALARSGINHFTLIDLDDICVSNINRQVMATSQTIGRFKAEVLRERILSINPCATVNMRLDFVTRDNVQSILFPTSTIAVTNAYNSLTSIVDGNADSSLELKSESNSDTDNNNTQNNNDNSNSNDNINSNKQKSIHSGNTFDFVVDCVDGVSDKAAIIDACVSMNVPIVTSGSVGGLLDPTLLTVSDLSETLGDNLLMRVRKKLRQEYGYPRLVAKNSGTKSKNTSNSKNTSSSNNAYNGNSSGKNKKWRILSVHSLPTGARRDQARLQLTSSSADTICNDSNSNSNSNDDIKDNNNGINNSNINNIDSSNTTTTSSNIQSPKRPPTSTLRKCDVSLSDPSVGMGNACFTSGTVGFLLASLIVNRLAIYDRDSLLWKQYCVPKVNRRFYHTKNNEPYNSNSDDLNNSNINSNYNNHNNIVDNADDSIRSINNDYGCSCGSPFVHTHSNANDDSSSENALLHYHERTLSVFQSYLSRLQCKFSANTSSSNNVVPVIDAHCHLQFLVSPLQNKSNNNDKPSSDRPNSKYDFSTVDYMLARASNHSLITFDTNNATTIISHHAANNATTHNKNNTKKHTSSMGVSRVIVCGVSPLKEDWQKTALLYERYPATIVPNFGVHPWWIAELLNHNTSEDAVTYCTDDSPDNDNSSNRSTNPINMDADNDWQLQLQLYLQQYPMAGVGECGLDKIITKPSTKNPISVSLDVQSMFLQQQLTIAGDYERTVTLHCVQAWGRLLSELQLYFTTANSTSTGNDSTNKSNTGIATMDSSKNGKKKWPRALVLHSSQSCPLNFVSLFLSLPVPVYFSLSSLGNLDNIGFTDIDHSINTNSTNFNRSNSRNSKQIEHYRQLLSLIPLDRLLIETDSPDQLPTMWQGSNALRNNGVPATDTSDISFDEGGIKLQHNEPAITRFVLYDVFAALQLSSTPNNNKSSTKDETSSGELTVESLAQITCDNTKRAFGVEC